MFVLRDVEKLGFDSFKLSNDILGQELCEKTTSPPFIVYKNECKANNVNCKSWKDVVSWNKIKRHPMINRTSPNLLPEIARPSTPPPKKSIPPPLSPKLKTKLNAVMRQEKMNCSDFAIKQVGNTCFMAAANLIASRVFMSGIKNDEVRRFLFYSNANRHSDALGDDIVACPKIPKKIRELYKKILINKTKKFDGNLKDFERYCSEKEECKNTKGGHTNFNYGQSPEFLLSLLLVSDFSVGFFNNYWMIVENDKVTIEETSNIPHYYKNPDIIIEAYEVIKESDEDETTKNTKDILSIIEKNYDHEDSRYRLRAFILYVKQYTHNGKLDSHVICAFPCKNDYIICNSQKEGQCYSTVDDFLLSNGVTFAYFPDIVSVSAICEKKII